MFSKNVAFALLVAYAEARFGQEQVPIAAISAVQGGAPGAAATIAGATISDLLGAANACAKVQRADQIVTELGGGQDAIDAAIGLLVAEKNTNPFGANTQFVCGDATLPVTPELRGITTKIDPENVDLQGLSTALAEQTSATPLDATGKSIFDLMSENGLADLITAQNLGGQAAAGGNANAGNNQQQAGNANAGNNQQQAGNANNNNNQQQAGNANAGNNNQGNANAGAAEELECDDNNAAAGNATQNAGGNANAGNANAGKGKGKGKAKGKGKGNAGNANAGNNQQQAGNANAGNANAGNANAGNNQQQAGNANAGNNQQQAGNANAGNNNANQGNAGNAAAGGAADFGLCQPTIFRAGGLGGRPATEFTFQIEDTLARGGQQEALNPNIITNALCNQLTNVCEANAAAKALCEQGKAAVAAAGTRDDTTVTLFNGIVNGGGAKKMIRSAKFRI